MFALNECQDSRWKGADKTSKYLADLNQNCDVPIQKQTYTLNI